MPYRLAAALLALALLPVAPLAAIGAADAAARPTLTLLDDSPLTVRAAGFAPRERVVATASTLAGPRILRAAASAKGVVTFRFRTLAVDPCSGAFAIRVRGSRSGAAVSLKLAPPLRVCPDLGD